MSPFTTLYYVTKHLELSVDFQQERFGFLLTCVSGCPSAGVGPSQCVITGVEVCSKILSVLRLRLVRQTLPVAEE